MANSETLDVIARRYSCRAFADTPVPKELLQAVAEAGARSPSAVNLQPWRLVVISNADALHEIDRTGVATLEPAALARVESRGGRLLYNAPAMIVIAAATGDHPYPVTTDVGIVAAQVTLAAVSLGLATCIAAMPAAAFRGESGRALRERFIPDGFEFELSVLLGYPAQPGGTQHEPDFSKILYYG